jgi:hypothetical protein
VKRTLNVATGVTIQKLAADIETLKLTQAQQMKELRLELEKTKGDVYILKEIIGAGGTQFDDAPANATAA